MKILITGMNKNQCTENFYTSQQLKVVPSHPSLVACLRDMGHEVEQRLVIIGEDLSKYDRVICFLHTPRSATQLAFFNGLWAIHAADKDKLIFAFDDWQIHGILYGIETALDDKTFYKDFILEQNQHTDKTLTKDTIVKYSKELKAAVEYVCKRETRALISAFAGGDLSLLTEYPKDLLYSYNPNPYHINRQPAVTLFPEPKQKVFNFAGLVQSKTKTWLKNQKVDETGWPLKQYGSRSDGQDRLTEEDMVNTFAQHWGILMAGYNHSGSGWWRARPLQVADCDSILIGHPKETMLYYKDERLASITAKQVAEMTEEERVSFAKEQKDALYANHPLDKKKQQEELKNALGL